MIAPRTKLLHTTGHAFLPLAVKVKQSLANPEIFYIEAYIDGGCMDDRVAADEPTARNIAANMFAMWVRRLMPAFNAGYALATKEVVQ